MANKKDVINAFYEGVCVTLSEVQGLNIWNLPIDHDHFRKWAKENDYTEIEDWYVEQ